MTIKKEAPTSVDDYIKGFPEGVQGVLEQIRTTIHKAVPGVDETIRYQMPCFNHKGRYLIYIAAYKKHVGLYPAPLKRRTQG